MKHKNKRSGFSLIEALISAVILGIGLVAMGGAIYSGFVFIQSIKELSASSMGLRQEIETVRRMPYNTILALGASSSFTAPGFTSLQSPNATLNVQAFNASSDIRRVTATVSWTSGKGNTVTKSIATLITRAGIDRI